MSVVENQKLALEFYKMAFVLKEPLAAAREFLGNPYIQHNPCAKDGREFFGELFTRHFRSFPDSSVTVKRVVSQGDLVVLHVHSKMNLDDLGQTVVEIFRFDSGK
ncbi:MAG: nuclear transport factor 2 family protein, partial [Cryobacterium sp.]|nr:nuclear transport factor 2 family protein [Oligoflexia bacterium]